MKKVESKDDAKNLALIQQFNELENIWKSQENSRRRYSSTASDHSSISTSFDNFLFQTSPRTLMSSLQHRKPASFGVNNCSNNAVEEILMDRRAAITSGRVKGRQLFVAAAEEEEEEESALTLGYSGGEICSDWINGIQEREVMINFQGSGDQYDHELSSDFSESCSLPEEKLMVVEEKAAVEVAEATEKRGGDGRRKEKGGGRRVATASLGVVLIVFALVLFFISCNGNNVEDFILVPT